MLDGRQVRLRDLVLDDLEAFAYWQGPGHEWQKLDGPYYPKTPLSETQRQTIQDKIVADDLPDPRTRLAIADRDSDTLCGMVTRYWISQETYWTAVGIVIFDPAHWGKGVGYEALGLWSDYLFRTMTEIVRLDLRTWSGNQGMMRLALKLGYQQEARFRRARIVEGAYYDGLGYGILREEWDAKYPQGFQP